MASRLFQGRNLVVLSVTRIVQNYYESAGVVKQKRGHGILPQYQGRSKRVKTPCPQVHGQHGTLSSLSDFKVDY